MGAGALPPGPLPWLLAATAVLAGALLWVRRVAPAKPLPDAVPSGPVPYAAPAKPLPDAAPSGPVPYAAPAKLLPDAAPRTDVETPVNVPNPLC